MDFPRHIIGGLCAVPAARHRRSGAFTLIELLTVISIIAILAGLVVGLAPLAATRIRESRIKGEMADLVTAIEGYKAKYGVYPPDNYDSVRNIVDPALNPLFYELSGMIVVNTPGIGDQGHFETIDTGKWLRVSDISVFHRDGFVNSATRDQIRRIVRHSFRETQHASISRVPVTSPTYAQVEVLAVGFAADASKKKNSGFAWPLDIPAAEQPIPSNPGLNPWRYVSTNPTNNPGGFDLWAEVIVRGKKKVFGNWKQ